MYKEDFSWFEEAGGRGGWAKRHRENKIKGQQKAPARVVRLSFNITAKPAATRKVKEMKAFEKYKEWNEKV